ncbi:hypothetical protein [Mastigocoleus testarum]|nr:hypothetical protein [Mastigocoleus testarum]
METTNDTQTLFQKVKVKSDRSQNLYLMFLIQQGFQKIQKNIFVKG